MAENGIVNNLGMSKRSVFCEVAIGAVAGLIALEKDYVLVITGVAAIVVLAVAYMILDEIKDRRK